MSHSIYGTNVGRHERKYVASFVLVSPNNFHPLSAKHTNVCSQNRYITRPGPEGINLPKLGLDLGKTFATGGCLTLVKFVRSQENVVNVLVNVLPLGTIISLVKNEAWEVLCAGLYVLNGKLYDCVANKKGRILN